MTIKVRHIIGLLSPNCSSIRIFVDGDTYEFTMGDLPYEVYDMTVHSIDDPAMESYTRPLCINIDVEENFDDYEAFKAEFSDYEV